MQCVALCRVHSILFVNHHILSQFGIALMKFRSIIFTKSLYKLNYYDIWPNCLYKFFRFITVILKDELRNCV